MKLRKEVQAVIFAKESFLLIKKYDAALNDFHSRLVKGGIEKGESETDAKIIGKIYDYTFTFRDIKHKVSIYLVKADLNEKVKLSEEAVVNFIWENPETAIKILKWEDERNSLKIASKKTKDDA